jgi:predicted homoserine dehydrogenase-like protein
MADILSRLKSLATPIRVGIIGAGHTGKALLYQCGITPGIKCVAIADIKVDKALAACSAFGHEHRLVENLGDLHDTIARGAVAVSQDGELLARCESMDVLIESSSAVGAGGHFAAVALENHLHVVMMNAESDLIFGPYLMGLAEKNGVVYTTCDGDQPGVIKRLVDEVTLWGFELVMAGNIKGFLDRYVNPTSIIPEADKRFLDYKMCTAYTDGTKLSVEMALVANALGLETDTPGMHGPRAKDLLEVFDLFDLDRMTERGCAVVDYVLGSKPYGGVFLIARSDHPFQQTMMDYFPSQMGTGPYYVFNRPYHLCHVEAMQCVTEAYLDHQALLQPTAGFRTNVYAYAKRDLHKGDTLDGIGGYACYGMIENCSENETRGGLPVCLADEVTLKRDIAKDQKVFMDDIVYDASRQDYRMYALALEESRAVTS